MYTPQTKYKLYHFQLFIYLIFYTSRNIFHCQHLLLVKVVVDHELEELDSAIEVDSGWAEVLLLAGLMSPP